MKMVFPPIERNSLLYIENLASSIEDRWFSSLWTLQEAFLSQWAYVISGEVEALYVGSPQLRSIFIVYETLYGIYERSVALKKKKR